MFRDPGELGRDAFRREHVVHAASGDGAARHGVVPRGVILRKRDAALGLDGLQAEGAIARRAGQNHANRPVTAVLGQRFEKVINGACRRACLRTGTQRDTPAVMLKSVLGGITYT